MQNDFGLISIIMAAYNAEKTIEQAINSVLSQTYPDFELLVVNDCSTDKTAMLAEAIVKKDDRIRLISNEKNSGVSYTRKHGLEEASGEWVAILDSDDAWAPEKLEKQIKLQKKTNALQYNVCNILKSGRIIPDFIEQRQKITAVFKGFGSLNRVVCVVSAFTTKVNRCKPTDWHIRAFTNRHETGHLLSTDIGTKFYFPSHPVGTFFRQCFLGEFIPQANLKFCAVKALFAGQFRNIELSPLFWRVFLHKGR